MGRDVREALVAQATKTRDRFLGFLKKERSRSTQDAVLSQLVGPNAETAFGQRHHFAAIDDLHAFRTSVPIHEYDDLRPWIDRSADGEANVLTREAPIRFWKTTGTTSRPKRIPLTPAAAARVTESWLIVYGTQVLHCPEVSERADSILLTHISPKSVKERVPSGVPYCSTTEAPLEIRPGQERFVAPWLVPLQGVVEDDAERLYFLLCFAALHDLYAIGCLHPSRFQTIMSVLDRHGARLIREVAEGTILGKKMRDPMPQRASALEGLVARTGTLLPRDIWPHLKFLSSWSGSYIDHHLPLMERAFCTDFIPMPAVSSECFMTMTIDKDKLGQPLNIRGGLFEFVPSGEPVTPNAPTLLFHELKEGASYEIIITTFGGLYRYAIRDIFRVTGFVDDVPRLEYVARRAVTDLTGEKLADEQVTEVVRATLAKSGGRYANFTLCAVKEEGGGRTPRYVLVLESSGDDDRDQGVELARTLDEGFKAANSRYELKRNFQDLSAAEVVFVSHGTFTRYRQLLIERGMPAGQVKDRVVHPVGGPVLQDLLRLHRSISS